MRGGSESIRRALKAFLQFVVVALEILRSSFLCKCGQRRLRRHSSIGNTRILVGRGHEEIGEIEVRAIVIGGDLDGARQCLESALAIADSQVALAELEMRLSESGIDLEGIGVLDRGLAVFSLSEVLLAAVKIFLLASIGIACAACENTGQQCTQNQKSNCVRALSARIC